MTAKQLVKKMGRKLIGRTILTVKMGEYPGGLAKVIALNIDRAAPEIVCNVRHPAFGEIGVFENEEVMLMAVRK